MNERNLNEGQWEDRTISYKYLSKRNLRS